jgi:hypothetical protein
VVRCGEFVDEVVIIGGEVTLTTVVKSGNSSNFRASILRRCYAK